MSEDVPARFLARLKEPPPSPLEATRTFLRGYASDANGIEEIHDEIARAAVVNPRGIVRALEGIEALLAHPPGEGTLARLVAWDGNRALADPGDDGATAWLRDMAEYIRGVLGDRQPPRPTDTFFPPGS